MNIIAVDDEEFAIKSLDRVFRKREPQSNFTGFTDPGYGKTSV